MRTRKRPTRNQRIVIAVLGGLLGGLAALIPNLWTAEEEFVPRSPHEVLLESE